MTDHKLRQDGSIDYDFYRAEAARERKAARDRLVWEGALPFLWIAPVRLVTRAGTALALWGRAVWSSGTARRPERAGSAALLPVRPT